MSAIDLIFLTYNRRGIVARCFLSMWNVLNRPDINWMVLDNASTDGTAEWLLSLKNDLPQDRMQLYLSAFNRGVSGGRNFLLKRAPGDIHVFLDSDVAAVHPNWLARLIAPLDDESIGIAGPGGHFVTLGPDGRWRWFEAVAPDYRGLCDTVSGYCMAFRHDALGDFEVDTAYGRYWLEDTDQALSFASRGLQTWCTGDIGLRHLFANSARDDSGPQKMAYMESKWGGKGLIRAEREQSNVGI